MLSISDKRYGGKIWQTIEIAAFVGVGIAGLQLLGVQEDLTKRAGYAALTFLVGKGTYFTGKGLVSLTPFKDRKIRYLGKVENLGGIALGILASTCTGTCLLPEKAWNFGKALTLSACSYLPAVALREGTWKAVKWIGNVESKEKQR